MPVAVCPECDEDVVISGRPLFGQTLLCQACGVRLEVVEVDPLELDWSYDEPEDFDDEDLYEDKEEETPL